MVPQYDGGKNSYPFKAGGGARNLWEGKGRKKKKGVLN